MASLSAPPPLLASCIPFCTTDPVLGHILVFFNPSLAAASSSSRIEAHIVTCAGLQSYPKLALAPSSPLYAAINHLPPQKQNSEIHRGLAIAVLKYFFELPKIVKETVLRSKNNVPPAGEGQAVAFDEMHAGDLAARLKELESESLAYDITSAFSERFVGCLDVDIIMRTPNVGDIKPQFIPDDMVKLLDLFGEPTHLPFTKLKRAPSRPASTMSRPKSLKDPVEALNRELEELRHTEANYVAKLQELLEYVVKPLRRNATQKKGDNGYPTARDLEALFPPCLDRILEVNMGFLAEVEKGGIEDVAKCCLRWFPEFKDSYADYLCASPEFPQLLTRLSKDKHSSISKRIQQTGEQKLRSLIIEPVQRLPRYTLFIDNIINVLPPDHPSLTTLNDARDVITEICSLQSSDTDERSTTTKRLQSMIISWPPSLKPTGRLITAIDFLDVLPPFNDNTAEAIPSTLLLFADRVIIIRRPKSTSLLARSIMAEVDRPGAGTSSNSGSGGKRDGLGNDLQFAGWIDLADTRFAESDQGDIVWMTLVKDVRDCWDVRAGGMGVRRMRLLNAYEGRASRLIEDIVKAKLERRIASAGTGIIGLREVKFEGIGVWGCVWGNQRKFASEQRKSGVVVYVDNGSSGSGTGKSGRELATEVGKNGVDIAVSVESTMGKKLRIEFRSWNDYSSTDTVSVEEFLAVFTKRVSSLLRLHSLPQHPPLTACLMSANRKLMRSLGVPYDGESRFSRLRPPSPVKLFSSFLGNNNSQANIPGSPSKSRPLLDRTQSQMLPPKPPERTSSLLKKRPAAYGLRDFYEEDEDEDDDGEVSLHRIYMASENPLKRLEETFEAFVIALRMVSSGDSDLSPLRDEIREDDPAIEEFLEQMARDPKNGRVERDLGVDVVFGAFGRFLREFWKDGMGPIITGKALIDLQNKSDSLYPGDFEDFFKIFVLDWTPQNQRAFRTIVLLLREMQSRIESPDDRGILTKAFTELLVEEGDPLEFMPLIDRLVEEAEHLFSGKKRDTGKSKLFKANRKLVKKEGISDLNGTVKRAKSVNTGSVAPASSLRRRFGLSHNSSTRDKYNGEGTSSKAPSVWRTLSKGTRKEDIVSKGHLGRSRSTDYDARTFATQQLKRPSSRDRPNVLGLFNNPPGSSQGPPSSSHGPPLSSFGPGTPARPLSTILGSPAPISEKPLPPGPGHRRKRRSSLSDLTSQHGFQIMGPPPGRLSPELKRVVGRLTPDLGRLTPDMEKRPASRSDLSGRRETTPSPRDTPIRVSELGRPGMSGRSDPALRKVGSGSGSTLGAPPSPQRLKMQSTQKLRERLQNEKQAITRIEPGLQREIDKIGEELNIVSKPPSRPPSAQQQQHQNEKIKELTSRLHSVENKIASSLSSSSSGSDKTDAELRRKQKEIQGLDKLFNDCLTENDVMFERFNEELVKISSALKAGRGEADLLKLLQEARAEQGRLKRENAKLRRENINLRAVRE